MLFNSVDWMPTLLGLAGVTVPEACEGADLSRALLEPGSAERPECAYLGYYAMTRKILEARDNVADIGWRAARFENAIFVVERDRKTGAVAEHAFDLAADPLQLHPLATGADAPAWVRDARARLRKHLPELSDSFSDWLAA